MTDNKLFVYGTLVGKYENRRPATLKGARKQGLCITPDPEGEVEGELIKVSDEELRKLDRYEGVPKNYKRVAIEGDIEAYIGNPEHRMGINHDYKNLEEEFEETELEVKTWQQPSSPDTSY